MNIYWGSQHTGEAYKPDHYGKAIHIGSLPLVSVSLVEYMSRLVRLLLFGGDLYNLNPGAVPILYQLKLNVSKGIDKKYAVSYSVSLFWITHTESREPMTNKRQSEDHSNEYLFEIKFNINGKKPLGHMAVMYPNSGMYSTGDWLTADSKESVRYQVQENWPNAEIVSIRSYDEVNNDMFNSTD